MVRQYHNAGRHRSMHRWLSALLAQCIAGSVHCCLSALLPQYTAGSVHCCLSAMLPQYIVASRSPSSQCWPTQGSGCCCLAGTKRTCLVLPTFISLSGIPHLIAAVPGKWYTGFKSMKHLPVRFRHGHRIVPDWQLLQRVQDVHPVTTMSLLLCDRIPSLCVSVLSLSMCPETVPH